MKTVSVVLGTRPEAIKLAPVMLALDKHPHLKPCLCVTGQHRELLKPFLEGIVPAEKLREILEEAYDENQIPTEIQHVTGRTYIMWLTKGPTYSFKDYAARFFGRTLEQQEGKLTGLKRLGLNSRTRTNTASS